MSETQVFVLIGLNFLTVAITMLSIAWRIGQRVGEIQKSYENFCLLCNTRMQEHQAAFKRIDELNQERSNRLHLMEMTVSEIQGRHKEEDRGV